MTKTKLLLIALGFSAFMFVVGLLLIVGIPYAMMGLWWLAKQSWGGYAMWGLLCLAMGFLVFSMLLPVAD